MSTADTIAVILIAAGASRRFGVADKLYANYHDQPLITHALALYQNTNFSQRILVTRPDSGLEKLPQAASFHHTANPQADKGMGTSIAAGMTAVSDARHVLIALADMPNIQPQTIARLLATAQTQTRSIIVPTFEGKDGHPVIFGAVHFAALAALDADTGGRDIIRKNPSAVSRLAVDDAGVVFDIDTPEELSRAHA